MSDAKILREITRQLEYRLAAINRADCCSAVGTTQCFAIVEIGRAPGISVKELSSLLGMDKSSVSRLVEELVKGAYVERRISEVDRRWVALFLLPRGQERFENIENEMNSRFEAVLESIPEEKRETVIESLRLYSDACASAEERMCEDE